jgi:hypothetical protein
VRQSRSCLALETSSQIAILNRLRRFGRKESATVSKVSEMYKLHFEDANVVHGQLTRAMRSLSETPQDIPFGGLVCQAGKDIVAAEKLHTLEARKRETGKTPAEKQR